MQSLLQHKLQWAVEVELGRCLALGAEEGQAPVTRPFVHMHRMSAARWYSGRGGGGGCHRRLGIEHQDAALGLAAWGLHMLRHCG